MVKQGDIMNQLIGMIAKVEPVIDYTVRGLCVKTYPGHKRGCPNYNHKKGCPPYADYFDKVYDLSKPVYAIVNSFDFYAHVSRMKEMHPEWSQRQLECCLYWQPKARKQLFGLMKGFLKNHRFKHEGYKIEPCPEAMGVEITKTLAAVGVNLEWPPKNIARQVALAAVPLKIED